MDYSFPSEKDVWNDIYTVLEEDTYRERANTAVDPMGIGAASALLYLRGGGRRYARDAYYLGALIGVNTRIVDDLLDGDGCEPVDDRDSFLDAYVTAFETGEEQPVQEQQLEAGAYHAATILHESLDTYSNGIVVDVTDQFRVMKQLVVEEDKSTRQGYKRYVSGAGGVHGSLLATALNVFPDYEATEEQILFAYDMGFGIQVADDIFDNDIELASDDLHDIYDHATERAASYDGVLPWILPKLKPVFSLINHGSRVLRTPPIEQENN